MITADTGGGFDLDKSPCWRLRLCMLKKFLFALVTFVAGIVIIEALARQTESYLQSIEVDANQRGWQTRFFSQIMDWHEPDPDLLWRFKSNLQGKLIRTDNNHTLTTGKPNDATLTPFQVLLLGDSSPVGLGLASRGQAFGELLEYLLGVATGGKRDVRLINAAVSGYSSAQIARQIESRVTAHSPDLVILYCGNNDASISGGLDDNELLESQRLGGVRKLVDRLASYRLLRNLIQSTKKRQETTETDLKVRVTPEQYENNLKKIAAVCEAARLPLIIIKPPVPRLWPVGLQFKPFLNDDYGQGGKLLPEPISRILGRKILYCIDSDRLDELYGTADLFTRMVYRSIDPITDGLASRIIDESARQDSNLLDPITLNNLGVALWHSRQFEKSLESLKLARTKWVDGRGQNQTALERTAGAPILYNMGIVFWSQSEAEPSLPFDESSEAFIYLDSALQDDFFSLRIKRTYCDRIDSLLPQDKLYVITLDSLFAANGGEKLFVDHCHPTAHGHRLIAQALAELITSKGILK